MEDKLNNIASLEEWSNLFLKPALAHINSAIKNFNIESVAYSRVEVDLRADLYNWNVSVVSNEIWKKSEDDWIDEVVLSIDIWLKHSQIQLNADVSYGNGEILFEICPISMIYRSDLQLIDFEENFNMSLKLFCEKSIGYIYNALLVIQDKAVNDK